MLRVIGLGAGVQSSTVLLMAKAGEIEADCAIFADTQHEPKRVYEWLEFLKQEVAPFPIHVVTAGSLIEGVMENTTSLPLHVDLGLRLDGSYRKAMTRRQCTAQYKIEPIQHKIRELLGLKPRQRAPKEVVVQQLFGISNDEVERMRQSSAAYVENLYPLINPAARQRDGGFDDPTRRMSRHDCKLWLERHGYPEPPKSACTFCPFHNNKQWRDIKENDPLGWKEAVDFEATLQQEVASGSKVGGTLKGTPYFHASLKPLPMVDLTTARDGGQLDLFQGECEGMCGV